jgi:DNA invertase Pin-like site-specific DNA recombinase
VSSTLPGAAIALPQRFVAYYRVSTDRQGRSRLGLDAQRAAVAKYAAGAGGVVAAEFEEVESSKRTDRPQLAAALAACLARRAALVIAKLDQLARNARFLLHLVEGTGKAGVVFCDLPSVLPGPVGKFLMTQMATVAELEAGLISQRSRAALAAAKARGTVLGNPRLWASAPEHAGPGAGSRRAALPGVEGNIACKPLPYVSASLGLLTLVGDPHRQAPALAQAGVILTPVRSPESLLGDVVAAVSVGFERHRAFQVR